MTHEHRVIFRQWRWVSRPRDCARAGLEGVVLQHHNGLALVAWYWFDSGSLAGAPSKRYAPPGSRANGAQRFLQLATRNSACGFNYWYRGVHAF